VFLIGTNGQVYTRREHLAHPNGVGKRIRPQPLEPGVLGKLERGQRIVGTVRER
jgi:hypothetical protein